MNCNDFEDNRNTQESCVKHHFHQENVYYLNMSICYNVTTHRRIQICEGDKMLITFTFIVMTDILT